MARPLRIEFENGLFQVRARGWERRVIVDSDRDRADWVRLLDRIAVRRGLRVFAWVLMRHDFHIFVKTRGAISSAGMHDLNSDCASLLKWFEDKR